MVTISSIPCVWRLRTLRVLASHVLVQFTGVRTSKDAKYRLLEARIKDDIEDEVVGCTERGKGEK